MRRPSHLPALSLFTLAVGLALAAAVISNPAEAMRVVQQAAGTPTGTSTTTPTGTATGVPLAAYPVFPAAHAHTTKVISAKTVKGTFAFSPKKTTIAIGTKVTWKNMTSAPHTVTSNTRSWKFNKSVNTGATVSYTFRKAGTYKYHCTFHPYMVGTIVVK